MASVPSGHVYVRHLAPDGPTSSGTAVIRLPDPRPAEASTPEQWWPPVMLDARWIEANADRFDLMHIHFGFDALSTDQLRSVVEALRRHGRPLVLTVHDLRNPHHLDRGAHDAHLDVLVPAAAAVLTLTPGAAREIAARWGRTAVVVPHPHVAPPAWIARERPPRDEFVVGLHCKSLRAAIDPLPVLDGLVEAVAGLPDARLVVDAHTDVMTPDHPRYAEPLASRLRSWQSQGALDLHVHDFYSDEQLWAYLQSLDLSVLPYRFGTHSGWLEACHDLGTAVLVSDCGYQAEQRPCTVYATGADGSPDRASVVAAVHEAHAARHAPRPTPEQRRAERDSVAAQHLAVYRSSLQAG